MAVCTYGGKTLKEMNVEQINIKIDKLWMPSGMLRFTEYRKMQLFIIGDSFDAQLTTFDLSVTLQTHRHHCTVKV